MQIGKKYYGILMIRQSIDPQIFVLKPKYVISGTLIEECGEKKLVDDMNGSYYLSSDTNTIFFEIETSVDFLITEEELKTKYNNCDIAEARAKYFEDICKSVYFYNNECVNEEHIDIISVDLADLISRKHACLYPGVKDIEDGDEKNHVSKLLEHADGDEIIAITTEELKKIIALGSYQEIKDRLQKVYDDTIEMNNHFLSQQGSKKVIEESRKRLTGDNIITLFSEVCDSFEEMTSLSEMRKVFKSYEETLINIMMILEKRGGPEADDCHAANDFICRLIDCFDDALKLRDLTVIKYEIKALKEKEMINIKQTAKIFDKYAEIFEEQRKNRSHLTPSTESKTSEDKPLQLLKAREMKSFLDKKVVGQDEAKKDIISAIIMNSLSEDSQDRNACLLIGPTGSGKTLIISTIADYLDRPVEIVDTMQLTVPGYVGANIEDNLSNLIDKAGGDVKRAEEGIISFDEIDKKGSERNSDVSGRGVLNTLLSFIQGTTYQVKYNGKTVSFDTSRLTIFATGAFTDVVKELNGGRISNKKPIGFATPSATLEEDVKYPTITIQDLVKYGNIPEELLGRIPTITQLSGHTKESLRKILIESESSALLAEKRKLAKIGVNLKWTEGYINSIVERALELQTGGRSLKSTVEKSVKEARWVVLENLGEYTCIVLGTKTATDNLDCTLIDTNGISHNLKTLVAQDTDDKKMKQLVARR